ncbi:MAG TPA: cation transporter [Candidatus Acidoferrales bacterium]|nr:cation transporter [Candidatus Acidoferrales bacterium]
MSARVLLLRRAITLEWITLTWMAIEGVVALWSGLLARSLSVTAFGLDSLIELVSASVVMWRLQTEVREGAAFDKMAEHRAHQLAGLLLLLLAAYVVIEAGLALWYRHGQNFTLPGLLVTLAAILIMYPLARAKGSVAAALSSRAMQADAAESWACLYLSITVVIGQVAQLVFNVWWIDACTSLAVVYFLVREGLEGIKTTECC